MQVLVTKTIITKAAQWSDTPFQAFLRFVFPHILSFGNQLFSDGKHFVKVVLMSGQLVYRWTDQKVAAGTVRLSTPRHLKGMFVLRIRQGDDYLTQKITIR